MRFFHNIRFNSDFKINDISVKMVNKETQKCPLIECPLFWKVCYKTSKQPVKKDLAHNQKCPLIGSKHSSSSLGTIWQFNEWSSTHLWTQFQVFVMRFLLELYHYVTSPIWYHQALQKLMWTIYVLFNVCYY